MPNCHVTWFFSFKIPCPPLAYSSSAVSCSVRNSECFFINIPRSTKTLTLIYPFLISCLSSGTSSPMEKQSFSYVLSSIWSDNIITVTFRHPKSTCHWVHSVQNSIYAHRSTAVYEVCFINQKTRHVPIIPTMIVPFFTTTS